MTSETSFEHSGLGDLTSVNWDNEHHRIRVAASLVKGVYTLERARRKNEACDASWWEFFGFQLLVDSLLVDMKDRSYFGVVYKYKYSTNVTPNTPRYVIAFRGTILRLDNICQDMESNLNVLINNLEDDSRIDTAMKAVKDIVSIPGASNVWLAGHSLGSARALFVGKKIVNIDSCSPIHAYLFNPPFISTPIEWINNEKFKKNFLRFERIVKAGVAMVTLETPERESFSRLASWTPNLFVNPYDPICYGYMEYFKQRGKTFGWLATQHTLGSLTFFRQNDSEPLHVIPSAHLVINKIPFSTHKYAHSLRQWFNPDNQYYTSETHQFDQ